MSYTPNPPEYNNIPGQAYYNPSSYPLPPEPPVPPQVVIQTASLQSPHPKAVICPFCHHRVITKTKSEVGTFTWIVVGGLIFVGCWLGCCLIPFYMDDFKDVHHKCPKCDRVIDVFRRM
ncbi:LITAF domain-containing protein-like [Clavelina lepadiformis]|uniref:LITAF domain-containing protein-like n=1 Tax=Clavelina lepadiformis TaxID=159417 RepID=UPI0040427688